MARGKEHLKQAIALKLGPDSGSASGGGHLRVSFQLIELRGFGSFGEQGETYSYTSSSNVAHGRGLVLLDGRVTSGGGGEAESSTSKSNGAGKTTLAMAALWA